MAVVFEARYRGTCDECDDAIVPGDQVRYGDDGSIQHDVCDDRLFHTVTDLDRDAAKPACPECFIIHEGECP